MADAITAAEAARPHTGKTVTARLAPGSADIDLGGTRARTLAYNNQLPGPLIRANMGDEIAVTVDNGLDHQRRCTGTGWRCAMTWTAPRRPPRMSIRGKLHLSVQFAPTRAPTGPTRTPAWTPTTASTSRSSSTTRPSPAATTPEWIVMLDDWTSGVGQQPRSDLRGTTGDGAQPVRAGTRDAWNAGMGQMPGMGGMGDMGHMPGWAEWARCPMPGVGGATASNLLGGDGGDVTYPTTSSMAASPPRQPHSPPSPGSASASASSTPAPTRPSGSRWLGTA